MARVQIGTAGWSIARGQAAHFPADGAGLERYAARFSCAEINSSFHRSHKPETWVRWRDSVPDGFSFSAKLSKAITHERKLSGCDELLAAALVEMKLLGNKLEVVLVQLPPSLAFEAAVAEPFLAVLRSLWDGRVAFEPRHPSWFEEQANASLIEHRVARVAADPARVETAGVPGGWRGFSYWRLHGSPAMYRSSYDDGRLEDYAVAVAAEGAAGRDAWCIFDNTASSAATGDALTLQELLSSQA